MLSGEKFSEEINMSRKDDIITELKSSFDADTTRSKIGRVREIYDVIAELKDGGMSLKNIVEILNKPDFNLGLDAPTLASYLYMIRKKKGLDRVVVVQQAQPQEAPQAIKPGKGKGQSKSPASPDLMDKEKHGATAKPEMREEEPEVLTARQKREKYSSQYDKTDETSSFLKTTIIKQKDH